MRYGQTAVNFDAQRDLDLGFGDTSLALGAEWRNENYKIVAGEPASYAVGPYFSTEGAGVGSQVFGGFMARSAVDPSRVSFAGYVELAAHLGDLVTVPVAARTDTRRGGNACASMWKT